MSPEQALGGRVALGPASDVYSLGAVLYELLVGQPALEGTLAEVLTRLQRGDFAPPRQVKGSVPRALEAICLKAMALQPENRYATGLALAADLERWLADEPVSAYAEPWSVRATRWLRMHRTLAGSTAAALVLAVVFLGALALLIEGQKRELAQQNVALEEANVRERAAAELAQKTIEDMTSGTALRFLEGVKELQPQQKQFLEQALAYYRQATERTPVDEREARRQGLAFRRMGFLQERLGFLEPAELSYRAAIKQWEQLAAEHPQVPEYRRELARSHNDLGIVLLNVGKSNDAEREYRAALKEQERLVAEHPQVPEYRRELARSHNSLGILLMNVGKSNDAEREYRAALKEQERLVAEHPQVPDFHNELAGTLVNIANVRMTAKQPAEARRLLDKARLHHEAALKANPQNVTYREFYRNNLSILSSACVELGDHAGAVEAAQKLARWAFEPMSDNYNSACLVSRSIVLAEKDSKLPEARRKELARTYADQAMALLRQAVAKGYKDVAHMKKDTDLDPLRNREDFKKLIAELEAAAKKKGPR
jgi:serine/threonine-protein kinase